MSGSSCATTGSPIVSSGPTTTSLSTVATPGTNSSISLGPSSRSACATGPTGSDQRDSVLSLDNGDGAGPAGRGAADLDWEAADHEAVRWERFEIVQLFEVAITDLAPGLVAFPDQPGIAGRGIFLLG